MRLGHGVRSIEDARLVDLLAERQIALEVCPTSNICLGVYPDYVSHPLRRLWEAGVLVTINSDDPPMFHTDLNQEYRALIDHFGFGADELEQVSLNGLRASLLPVEDKERMEAEFRMEFANLKNQLG
jgi:adenosine deaminase